MEACPLDFFTRQDVVQIARDLLGKLLITHFDGRTTIARITETEAYRAPDDRACHAYGNKRTKRTETMFMRGGHAYVYLCYGIHHLFNVVTGPKEMAQAVLIRAVEPVEGLPFMLERRGFQKVRPQLSAGPGVLTKALGITTRQNSLDMLAPDSPIRLADDGLRYSNTNISSGPRIGVDYARECAQWPWRFWVEDSKFVSKRK